MKTLRLLPLLFLTACAGFNRGCSSVVNSAGGVDTLVVQYLNDGQVMRCWRLPNTSVGNETQSDGIYWKSPDGHLVHISGWYNRVEVRGGAWDSAAKELDVDLKVCK